MTPQEIIDMYENNPDLTLEDLARKAGLDVIGVKKILLRPYADLIGDYPDDWYNEDNNGESKADRYMEELDDEPWESKTDYCSRMGFDM